MRWQPWLRVLVVERPRWHDGNKSERSTGEADVEGEFDILGHEAYEESDNLSVRISD